MLETVAPLGHQLTGSNHLAENRRLLTEEDAPGKFFALFEPGSVPEIYVDGSSGVLFGPSTTRMRFHRIVDAQAVPGRTDAKEEREVKLYVVMPTVQFVEFLLNTLGSVVQRQDVLLAIAQDNEKRLSEFLKRAAPHESDQQ